jgi:lipopolysaccharide/colanic/teichoic acid biosynthesis glycosyltransferase
LFLHPEKQKPAPNPEAQHSALSYRQLRLRWFIVVCLERPQLMTIENAFGTLQPAPKGQGNGRIFTRKLIDTPPIPAPYCIELGDPVNRIPHLNRVLVEKHKQLPENGRLVVHCVTLDNRRQQMKQRLPILWIFGWAYLFIVHRIAAKITPTRFIYEFATGHRRRVMSKAEILGRLVYCGFEIESIENNGKRHTIQATKSKKNYLNIKPSYGLLYRMPRVGRYGKTIMVYKIRTMHPYSEFLQDYMIKNHGYDRQGKGKIANDFRVLSYGAYMRKIWLDELPQLINVLKGEMRLVGARPLSQARFNQFPEDLQKLRTQYKPGCFPPYVALLMGDEKSNIEAERIYFAEKQKSPFYTDIKYLFLAVKNIALNNIRSA